MCNFVGNFWRFNEERYKCALGVGWSVSVELVIGPQCGISHVTEKGVAPTKMADFLQVSHITKRVIVPTKMADFLQVSHITEKGIALTKMADFFKVSHITKKGLAPTKMADFF